jgi:hypothetical protein
VVISAICDDFLKVYVNGLLVAESVWGYPTTVTVNVAPPGVVGVNCVDGGGNAEIMLSTSTNMVSDGSWRCSNTFQDRWNLVSITTPVHIIINVSAFIDHITSHILQHPPHQHYLNFCFSQASFDDRAWNPAYRIARHGDNVPGWGPMVIGGISSQAFWIWTAAVRITINFPVL